MITAKTYFLKNNCFCLKKHEFDNLIEISRDHVRSVAYLGFPAPGGKLSFGALSQPVHGSTDAKIELEIKRRRKLTRALQSPPYSCFLTRLKTYCDCDVIELTSGPFNLGNQ